MNSILSIIRYDNSFEKCIKLQETKLWFNGDTFYYLNLNFNFNEADSTFLIFFFFFKNDDSINDKQLYL